MRYLILNEKPSQYRMFKSALGGAEGKYDNYNFRITHARGHILRLADPQDQNDDVNFQDKVKHWSNTTTIPWKIDTFKWKKTYIKQKNKFTKRVESTKSILDQIKRDASGCDAIIIASDIDDSGEGDVLGQEILNQMHWNKTIYRCHCSDDQDVKAIRDSLLRKNLVDISDKSKNKAYIRGVARERFDYATMQLSRLATRFATEQNYDVLITPGRLKSAILSIVYNQIRARDTFVSKNQYQAIFIDDKNTKFINNKLSKYDNETLAGNDLTKLRASTITVDKAQRKSSAAPKLMNFAQLGVVVSKHGYSLEEMIKTYQNMYQDRLVSYPRTGDAVMTTDQWNTLSNIADTLADLVGVDKSLLVNRSPRKRYVTDKPLDHGANRPGATVPNSLHDLEGSYGRIGVCIYETLVKSFLAAMGPDYQYDNTKAFVTDFPGFTATKNVPVDMGYKKILQDLEGSNNSDKENEANQFGTQAKPELNRTKTTPPAKPTHEYILKQLDKGNVGTPATKIQTLSKMANSKDKHAVFKVKGTTYYLTPAGFTAGAVMKNTMISSAKVTAQLNEMADQVGAGKIPMTNIYKAVNMIIAKDRERMEQNAQQLDHDSYLKDKLPHKSSNQNNKYHGTLPDGTSVSFNKIFMTHHFSDEECKALLAGDRIQIQVKMGKGFNKKVAGTLKHQSFKKHGETIKYWGFAPEGWKKK